ncbi:hypothetical protein BJ508DRAFT_316423, partial [Ascobolus immersus RN42]
VIPIPIRRLVYNDHEYEKGLRAVSKLVPTDPSRKKDLEERKAKNVSITSDQTTLMNRATFKLAFHLYFHCVAPPLLDLRQIEFGLREVWDIVAAKENDFTGCWDRAVSYKLQRKMGEERSKILHKANSCLRELFNMRERPAAYYRADLRFVVAANFYEEDDKRMFFFTNFSVARLIYMVAWDRVKKNLRGDIDCFVTEALTPMTVLIYYTCMGGALWREETGSEQVPEEVLKSLFVDLYKAWRHLESLSLDPSEADSRFPKTVKTFADAAMQNIRAAFILHATTTRIERQTKKRRHESNSEGSEPKRRELEGMPPMRLYRRAGLQDFLEAKFKACKETLETLEAMLKHSREADKGLDNLAALTSEFF